MDCNSNIMNEIWKDIFGYEGLYQISNFGKIKNTKTNNILSHGHNTKIKHQWIYLWRNKKKRKYYIHRLVLETFVGPCPPGMECRHLDGNPQNNRLNNLKWGTPSENQKDKKIHGTFKPPPIYNICGEKHCMAKLNNKQVKIIKWLLKNTNLTYIYIGEIFDISSAQIGNIKRGITWDYIK